MTMCIARVEAFEHAGQLFRTEEEAVDAAIGDVAAKLFKEHSSDPKQGLKDNADALIRLLGKWKAIDDAKPVDATREMLDQAA